MDNNQITELFVKIKLWNKSAGSIGSKQLIYTNTLNINVLHFSHI